MLLIQNINLPAEATAVITGLQGLVNQEANYPDRVVKAHKLWVSKNSTASKKSAFRTIRDTLSNMCIGSVRCSYCEDSLADEVEHIAPKNLFPQHAFQWNNYLFACGPCNGPKSNRHGVVVGGVVQEFTRNKTDPIVPPPPGQFALINPRFEDPTLFLELDLGGVTPDGMVLDATFEFVVREGLLPADSARAEFTITVLGLNREVIRAARENAFGGFRARLREYVEARQAGILQNELDTLMRDILNTPHLTVFYEMRRQRSYLPQVDQFFSDAPEAIDWHLY